MRSGVDCAGKIIMDYTMLVTIGLVLAVVGLISLNHRDYRNLLPNVPTGLFQSPRSKLLSKLRQSDHFRGITIEPCGCDAARSLE